MKIGGVHPSIHDLEIKRNESQEKDLLISFVIMGTFLVLCTVCFIINTYLGLFFTFTGGFWGWVADEYYEKSITPTDEQLRERDERRGIGSHWVPLAEDKKD